MNGHGSKAVETFGLDARRMNQSGTQETERVLSAQKSFKINHELSSEKNNKENKKETIMDINSLDNIFVENVGKSLR